MFDRPVRLAHRVAFGAVVLGTLNLAGCIKRAPESRHDDGTSLSVFTDNKADGPDVDYESVGEQRYYDNGRPIPQNDPIGPEPPAAEFNAADLVETTRWLAIRSRLTKTFKDDGNAFANGTHGDIDKETVAMLKGKKITWDVTVTSVNKEGVISVGRTTRWPTPKNLNSIAPVTEVALAAANGPGSPKWTGTNDQLKALRPGDVVRLTGTIQGAKREPASESVSTAPPRTRIIHRWRIALHDATHSPIPK